MLLLFSHIFCFISTLPHKKKKNPYLICELFNPNVNFYFNLNLTYRLILTASPYVRSHLHTIFHHILPAAQPRVIQLRTSTSIRGELRAVVKMENARDQLKIGILWKTSLHSLRELLSGFNIPQKFGVLILEFKVIFLHPKTGCLRICFWKAHFQLHPCPNQDKSSTC